MVVCLYIFPENTFYLEPMANTSELYKYPFTSFSLLDSTLVFIYDKNKKRIDPISYDKIFLEICKKQLNNDIAIPIQMNNQPKSVGPSLLEHVEVWRFKLDKHKNLKEGIVLLSHLRS